MLKIVPVVAATLPCILLPIMDSGQSFAHTNYDEIEYQVPAEIAALRNCQSTEIELYFEGDLMKLHTAHFLNDAIIAAKDCGDAFVKVRPVKSEYTFLNPDAENNVKEASLYLESHNIGYEIVEPVRVAVDLETDFDHGHTVSVRIIPSPAKAF